MRKTKRKICFVITSFIHYSRNFLILEELKKRKDVELHVAIGGSAVIPKYVSSKTNVKKILEGEGYKNIHEVHFNLEGDSGVGKAKTAGLGVIEFGALFNSIKPDLIVARADRFEVLSAATAAAHLNIPIAHIEGGDLSGTIDESIRHSITKLSQYHFVTNDDAKRRVIQMGENPKYVFNYGSPDIEVVTKLVKTNGSAKKMNLESMGSGAKIDLKRPYLMVLFHSVTTEKDKMGEYTKMLIESIYELNVPTLWFWPNFDLGAESIAHEMRSFNDKVSDHRIHFLRYVPPRQFISLLNNTIALIGNSSAGIKECSYLGIPVVNIGKRQDKRLRGNNVVDVEYNKKKIKSVIKSQIDHGRYKAENLFKGRDTAKKIASKLSSVPLYIQKQFTDIKNGK